MMDAVIRIPAIDFNEALFNKIGEMIKGRNAAVMITVKDANESLRKDVKISYSTSFLRR